MHCPNCHKLYDGATYVPRLLVICGHSLCESCCLLLHHDGSVICPDCKATTFVYGVTQLPKNLALIAVKTYSRACDQHGKKYEAFCEKEKTLICIDCILIDYHKHHEMSNISSAYERYLQLWQSQQSRYQRSAEGIQGMLAENRNNQQQTSANYQQAREAIVSLFRYIRALLDKYEYSLLDKAKDTFTSLCAKFDERETSYRDSIEKIEQTMLCMHYEDIANDLYFLEGVSQRAYKFANIPGKCEEPPKVGTFSVQRKVIIDTVVKSLLGMQVEKQAKIGNANQNNLLNNYSSVSSKKDSRQFRKAMPLSVKNTSHQVACYPPTKKQPARKESSHQTKSTIQQHPAPSSSYSKSTEISIIDPKESLCHSFLSNMTSFMFNRKSIYIAGGFNDESNSILRFDLPSCIWTDVAPLSNNRSKFGCVAIDKQIFMFGGKKGKYRVSDGEVYDCQSSRSTRSVSMARNRSGFGMVRLGDLLYFIGGNDGYNILATVYTLNVRTGEWRKKESMHEQRDELAVVVDYQNRIYAIGGFGGRDSQPLRSVYMFYTKTYKWVCLPAMIHPRRALAAAVLADGVYAIGGFDGYKYMCSVYHLYYGYQYWRYVSNMLQSRCTHSAVAVFYTQYIYVFGGFDCVPLDTVYRYNVVMNQWYQVSKMPTPRFMHASVLIEE